jgi:hypothetical protein
MDVDLPLVDGLRMNKKRREEKQNLDMQRHPQSKVSYYRISSSRMAAFKQASST